MKVVATKQMLIEALLNEPLMNFQHGMWASDERGTSSPDNETCHVCAVGSFIRSKVATNSKVATISRIAVTATMHDSIAHQPTVEEAYRIAAHMAKHGLVLNAVSILFETECETVWRKNPRHLRDEMPKIIERLVRFVEVNSPEQFVFKVAEGCEQSVDPSLTVV